jgi:hypothetical protein
VIRSHSLTLRTSKCSLAEGVGVEPTRHTQMRTTGFKPAPVAYRVALPLFTSVHEKTRCRQPTPGLKHHVQSLKCVTKPNTARKSKRFHTEMNSVARSLFACFEFRKLAFSTRFSRLKFGGADSVAAPQSERNRRRRKEMVRRKCARLAFSHCRRPNYWIISQLVENVGSCPPGEYNGRITSPRIRLSHEL